MAHHVLRRLLKKKRFILGPAIEGVDVDPSLTRLYLMGDSDGFYYSRIHGININDWPDSLMVLSDAGPMYISRVDGIDINDWPDSLMVLSEAGPMFTSKIDGLSVDDWPDSLNVLSDADAMYSERINGINVDSWPETIRLMLDEGMMRGDSVDGLRVNRFVDSLVMADLGNILLAGIDGLAVKRFVGDISVLGDADAFIGGVLRGPELGDPSDLRTINGVDFFGLTLPPIEVGIQVKRFVNDLNILNDAGTPNLPSTPGIAVKTTVTDTFIAEQFDGLVGGVSRGPELGDPSPARIITMLGEALFETLIDRYDAIEVRSNATDILTADVSDPESIRYVYATSESADLLVAASANMEPTFFSYQRVYATSDSADLLFETQPESKDLLLTDDLSSLNVDSILTIRTGSISSLETLKDRADGLAVGPSDKTIQVLEEIDTAAIRIIS
jgi:hypothetical protein